MRVTCQSRTRVASAFGASQVARVARILAGWPGHLAGQVAAEAGGWQRVVMRSAAALLPCVLLFAAWTVVFAKTDPDKGHRGISAFVVPMNTPGVQIEKHLDKMGQRATDTSAFALTDVAVPAANRLGSEGEGFKIAMKTLDFTRPGTAAGAVGVAQAAYEHAVEYAKERVTFDVPIAMHQGINFLIADMATEIEAARLLVWQSAWLHDQGTRATLQSSFAKRFAADTAMKVTIDAVQVFGGYGYIKEYPVEKLMRDAKLFQIYEGTSQIQRLVIAKEIFLPRGE